MPQAEHSKGKPHKQKKIVCESQSSQEEGRVVLSLELEERGEGEEGERKREYRKDCSQFCNIVSVSEFYAYRPTS